MINKFTEQSNEALEVYFCAVTRRIEQCPELKHICEQELSKVLACYPGEVTEHVDKMNSTSATEYLNWAGQRVDELEKV